MQKAKELLSKTNKKGIIAIFGIAIISAIFITGCAGDLSGSMDGSEYIPLMAKSAVKTIELFVLTLVLSLILGLPVMFGQRSRLLPLKWLCNGFVWLFRGTPLMLQLFFFYYFFPISLGIEIDPFVSVVLTFVLNYAAYFAEIYRGGVAGIDRGQYEAAHALGLSSKQTMKDIILPQAMKSILPAIVNEAITLVKDTALAASIGSVVELMKATNSAVNTTTSMMPYAYAAMMYLAMTLVLTLFAKRIEAYFARYDKREDD